MEDSLMPTLRKLFRKQRIEKYRMEAAIIEYNQNDGPKPDGMEVHQFADEMAYLAFQRNGADIEPWDITRDHVGDACKVYRQNVCAQKAKLTSQCGDNGNQCQVIPMAMSADKIMRSCEPCALAKEFLRKSQSTCPSNMKQ